MELYLLCIKILRGMIIYLTETGNFHIGETDVDEKCTK